MSASPLSSAAAQRAPMLPFECCIEDCSCRRGRRPARALSVRGKLRERLRAGKLDELLVEIDVKDRGPTCLH